MYLEYHTVVVLCHFFWFWREIVFGVMYVLIVQYRSLLRPEKKVLVGKKRSSSYLTGRCAIVITTGKKSSSRLSGECAIIITTGKKSSSRDFYAKLNVLNLNETNLY